MIERAAAFKICKDNVNNNKTNNLAIIRGNPNNKRSNKGNLGKNNLSLIRPFNLVLDTHYPQQKQFLEWVIIKYIMKLRKTHYLMMGHITSKDKEV
jgi:hypothetical protein